MTAKLNVRFDFSAKGLNYGCLGGNLGLRVFVCSLLLIVQLMLRHLLWCLRMATVTQVKMWTMEGDFAMPQYDIKLRVFEEEMYALLRVCLEEKLGLEWSIEFWDNDDICRIQ